MPGELSEHILFESEIACAADIRCRPHDCARTPEETTENSSIAFVRSGVFCKHVHREEVVADATQVVFFNRREPYRVSHPVQGGDDCLSLRLDARLMCDAAAVVDPSVVETPDRPFPWSSAQCSPRAALLMQVLRGDRRLHDDRLRADEICLELLRLGLEGVRCEPRRRAVVATGCAQAPRGRGAAGGHGRRSETTHHHRRIADRTRLYLAARYRGRLTLSDAAEAVGCSAFHLVRLFRRETGLPVHRYLNRLRLCAGLEQLAESRGELTGLALDLGFSSHSHFTDAFRREFGMSPSSFRRELETRRGVAAVLRQVSKNLEV